MAVIQINQLQKNYGKRIGIKDVSFTVEKGEILGFVGPNGAGKSTTIRSLLGLLFSDSGLAMIGGLDCATQSKQIKEFTGYVPSEVRLYGNMRVGEFLKYNGFFYNKSVQEEATRLCEIFGVDVSKKIRELSTGNKKKISVISALAAKPEVIILDEPTSGLDPIMQKVLFEELKRRVMDGVTVLLSSHNLAEVQEYCDRVAFIRNGSIIAIADVKESAVPRKIIKLTGGAAILPSGWELLKQDQNIRVLRASCDSRSMIEGLALLAPDDFTVETESMEERFWDLYGKEDLA